MAEKILLVDPPFQKFMDFSKAYAPLGLLYIAGEMKKAGHIVKVFDADYNPHGKSLPFITKMEHYAQYLQGLHNPEHGLWNQTANVIRAISPDVLGISLISTKLASGVQIARIAREMGVKRIIAGGPHASIDPNEVLESGYFDAVVMGEGESVFPRALKEDGIIKSDRITDLDSLAWPDRESLVGLEDYQSKDLGIFITSRGCPNSCAYCCSEVLWGKKVRSRSIENVVAEISDAKRKFGLKEAYIIDDTFTYNPSRVLDFCDRIAGENLDWSCLTRVTSVNDGLVKSMVESGCKLVKVGLESGNEDVLKSMKKNIKKDDVRKASEIFKSHDLPWMAYVMIGVPGETDENVNETIDFIREVQPTFVSMANFTPYPGTDFYKQLGLPRLKYEEHNHHCLTPTGTVSAEKIRELAAFSDGYNSRQKK